MNRIVDNAIGKRGARGGGTHTYMRWCERGVRGGGGGNTLTGKARDPFFFSFFSLPLSFSTGNKFRTIKIQAS